MNKGQVTDAERRALTELDKWNDTTGFFDSNAGGYWFEVQAIIEDAVHIGIQMALYGKVNYGDDGHVLRLSDQKDN